MKNLFLLISLFAIPFFASAYHSQTSDVNADVIKSDTLILGWGHGGDKSVGTYITFIQNDNIVYLHHSKPLTNLYIGVTTLRNEVVYSETAYIPANTYYTLDLTSLPADEYYITLIQGSNYAVHRFEIE